MAIIEAEASPSPPFSTEGLGPCEVSYSHTCNIFGHRWVFWSTCGNDEGGCGKPHHLSATADLIKDQIIRLLLQLFTETNVQLCLVQFWGLVKIGDKTYLTTCDQPFALCYPSDRDVDDEEDDVDKLCEYRKHCLGYSIHVDDEVELIIGPPGRAFRSGLPEYAPRVDDYTIGEYPQRAYAVDRIVEYWAFPIDHHPTLHLPIGVLEIVSPYGLDIIRHRVLEKLQNLPREVNLTTTCISLVEASSCQDGEIAKIEEVLDEVSKIYKLKYDDTETWTTSGQILSSHRGVDFIWKGQGVVGRAFSSKSACFCSNVRELKITEYPLVVQARSWKNSACFAVCLQSSCSNNCIYVLEFLLRKNKKDYRDPRTLLNSIMKTLKKRLGSSFKIASGQELGQKLTVEVIKDSPEDEFDSFEICSTANIESQPRLEEVQGGDGMAQLDFSSQQVDDAANGSMNCIHEQQNGSAGSTPGFAKAQGGEGMMQLDFSSQQVDDAANGSMNGIHEQQNGSAGSTPRFAKAQGEEGMMQLDFSSQQVDDAANGSMNGIHEQQNGSAGSTPQFAKAQGGERMMQLDFSSQQVDAANAYINGVHGQQSGIVGSPPRPEQAQGFINISHQELNLAGVDVAHNSMNGIYEQNNGIVESPTRQELPQNIENTAHDEGNTEINVANPERGGATIDQSGNEVTNVKRQKSICTLKSELGITREVLEQNSSRNLEDAAKVLGVSRSTLKRICREYSINRWPPRKTRKVNQAIAEQRVVQPSTENTEEQHCPDTTRLEDDSSVSVKVEYQGYTIKFRLPLSASKSNLEEKVARRLNLPIGNLKIEYQDEENEWIWITCDEDLSTCMSTLSSLDRTTIRMLVR